MYLARTKKQISNFVEFRDKYEQITCTNIFQDNYKQNLGYVQ